MIFVLSSRLRRILTLCLSLALLINPLVMARASVQAHPEMVAHAHCAAMQQEMSGMGAAMAMFEHTMAHVMPLSAQLPRDPSQHNQNCLNPCCGHGVMVEPAFAIQQVVRPEHPLHVVPVIAPVLMTAQGFYTLPDRPPRLFL